MDRRGELLKKMDQLHTAALGRDLGRDLGRERSRRSRSLDTGRVTDWCKEKIGSPETYGYTYRKKGEIGRRRGRHS